MIKNLKRNWLVISKWTWGIWWILTPELQGLKNLHFHWLFLTKLYNVRAEKVQMSYVWLQSILVQNSKENWLVFPKIYMRNLVNFHQSTWKSPNWDHDGILLSKVKNGVSLKIAGELCVMTMTNDAKFEEELTCQFKIEMRNLTNFDLSTRKSQKSTL